MDTLILPKQGVTKNNSKLNKSISNLIKNRYLYLLALPGILFFIIFKYLPMWGILIAFKDYSPYVGFFKSPWVGFKHFTALFTVKDFEIILRNTLAINFLNLLFFFPAPIIISILLNEVRKNKFKRVIQTAIYFPHFLSWVIIFSITYAMLSEGNGFVNVLLNDIAGFKIPFMTEPKIFWFLLVGQNIWKEAGWGTVIFLASITSIDPSLYEAATCDGAGRLRQMWHITLPGIRNVVITLFILRVGHIMDIGVEQMYLMGNPVVANLADVFDTYVFRMGVRQSNFSYSTAVGIFKSVVGLAMVVVANKMAKSVGEEGIY